jgi:ribose 5-phosphate isomerase A
MDTDEVKRLLGIQVVDTLVKSGMKLGLGTGSTAVHAVYRVGELLREGTLQELVAVPTSFQTEVACQQAGISLTTLNGPVVNGRLDLTIDGADEVDPQWNLIKGGGAAMLIEKVVAHASQEYCILVHSSKLSSRLGAKAPVPVEIVPEALVTASRRLEDLGGRVALRMAVKKAGPVISDHGNFVLDVTFAKPFDPRKREAEIMMIAGVAANGIFTRPVSNLFVGYEDGRVEHKSK